MRCEILWDVSRTRARTNEQAATTKICWAAHNASRLSDNNNENYKARTASQINGRFPFHSFSPIFFLSFPISVCALTYTQSSSRNRMFLAFKVNRECTCNWVYGFWSEIDVKLSTEEKVMPCLMIQMKSPMVEMERKTVEKMNTTGEEKKRNSTHNIT